MVAFLFELVHYSRSCGLDGFGWRSLNSNSALTCFVVLPSVIWFCVPCPYSAVPYFTIPNRVLPSRCITVEYAMEFWYVVVLYCTLEYLSNCSQYNYSSKYYWHFWFNFEQFLRNRTYAAWRPFSTKSMLNKKENKRPLPTILGKHHPTTPCWPLMWPLAHAY